MKYQIRNLTFFLMIMITFAHFITEKMPHIIDTKNKIEKQSDSSRSNIDHPNLSNRSTSPNIRCSQECLKCENGICILCPKGLYAFNEACYNTCPLYTKADNTSFKCLIEKAINNTISNTKGENEIKNLIKINDVDQGKLNSKKYYLSKNREETKKDNSDTQNQLNIEKMVLTKSQKLIDEISKDFHENKDLDNQVNKMESSIYKDSNLNLYLHGNQNLNILNNNLKTKILNHTIYNQNSFNSRNNTISNFDSYNVVKKIKTSGEINKSINHGSINIGNKGKKHSKSNLQNKHLNGRRKIDIDSNPYYQHNKLLGSDEKLSLNPDPPRFEKAEPEVKSSTNKNQINTYSKLTNEAPQEKSKLKPYNSQEVNIKEVRNHNKTTHSNENNNTQRNETSKNQSCEKQSDGKNQENSVGPKRGLIVGNSNVVRDNKIINNIIHVHNNYVFAGKGLNLTNSTSLIKQEVFSKFFPKDNIIQIDHDGLIIRGNFSVKLCEKIQNGICLKCKNNTVENIGGCECKQNYTYNVTSDSCDKSNVSLIIIHKNDTKSNLILNKHIQNITNSSDIKCNEGFFFDKVLKKCVKNEKKTVNSQQKISGNVSCSVNLCEKCKNGLCKKCVKHSVYSKSINECECKKGYRQKGNICKSKFFFNEGKKHKHMNLCIKYSSENICQKCKIHSYLNEKKNICRCRKGYHYNKFNNECERKICKKIPKNCASCLEDNKCIKCQENSTFNYTTQNCECNNGYHFNKKKNICKSKNKNKKEITCDNANNVLCKVCNDQEDCKECRKNAIFNQTKCVCKEGYYLKKNKCYTKKCSKIIQSCEKCEKEKCLICKKDSILNVNTGTCDCKHGYFYHKKSDKCKEKICTQKLQLCKNCNGENLCTKCKENSIYDPKKNSCFCKHGYKYDNVRDVCQKKICTKKMKLCERCNGDNICTRCQDNSNYSEYTNKCNCVKGFLYNHKTGKCQEPQCGELCISCNENEKCSQCVKDAYLDTNNNRCICRHGYYMNKKSNKCKKQSHINLCKNYKDGDCEQCVKNSILTENKKTKLKSCKCVKGYNFNPSKVKCDKNLTSLEIHNKNCSRSDNLCVTCNNENKCTECKKHSFYDKNSKKCVCFKNFVYNNLKNKCESNIYLQTGKNCVEKISLCKSCNDSNICTKCVKNSVYDSISKQCNCKLGYEFDKHSDSCKKKICKVKLALCKACDGENKCLICKKNSDLKNNSCQCLQGYSHNIIKNICEKTNDLNVDKCLKNQYYDNVKDICVCKKEFIFDSKLNKCIKKKDLIKNCLKKHPLCTKCNSQGFCKECQKHSIMDKMKKNCICKDHYRFNNNTNTCEIKKCTRQIVLCKACDENNECLKCKNNSIYDHSIEGCKCLNGFYHNKSEDKCRKIIQIPLCKENIENSCKKCVENAALDTNNNKCVCNHGYVEKNNNCTIEILNKSIIMSTDNHSVKNLTNETTHHKNSTIHKKIVHDFLNNTQDNKTNNTASKQNSITHNNSGSHNINNLNSIHIKNETLNSSSLVLRNETNKTCANLHLCTKCHDGVCSLCKENAVLNGKNCECKDEFSFNPLNSQCENFICESFKVLCSKCHNQKCIQCHENAHLNRNKECKCNKNYIYDDNKNQCLPDSCNGQIPLCAKCNNKGKCKKCKEGSVYNHIFNICLCEPNFYHNVKLDICVKGKEETLHNHKQLKCHENSFYNSIENRCQCKKGFYYCVKTNSCKKVDKIDLCRKIKDGYCIKCKKNANYDRELNECRCAYGYKHKKKLDFCQKIVPKEEKCKTHQNLCVHCKNEKCYDCKNYAELIKNTHSCQCIKGYKYYPEKDECYKTEGVNSLGKIELDEISKKKLELKKKCEEGKDLCKKCYSHKCIKCQENSNINSLTGKCECLKDHVLRNGKCINTKICQKPKKLCKVCEKEKCYKCKKHSILQSSKCSCKNGYTYNSEKNKCSKVYNEDDRCKNNIDLCKNCFGGDKCLKCKKNSFLKNGKCECLQGYQYNYAKDKCKAIIPENLKCKQSQILCNICNDKDVCLKCNKHSKFDKFKNCVCKQSFTFDPKKNNCKRDFLKLKEKNCKLTDFPSCRRCKNDKCVECKSHSSLDLKTHSCLCKNGFNLNNINNKCERPENGKNNLDTQEHNKNKSLNSSDKLVSTNQTHVISNKTNGSLINSTMNKTNNNFKKINNKPFNHINSTQNSNSTKINNHTLNNHSKPHNKTKKKIEKNCTLSDFASCKRCKNDRCLECKLNSKFDFKNSTCVCVQGFSLDKNKVCGKINSHQNLIHNTSVPECSTSQFYDEKSKKCVNKQRNFTISNKKKGNINELSNPYDPSSINYEPFENINFCEKGFKFSNSTKKCETNSLNSNHELKYVFTYYLHGHRTPRFLDSNKTDILGQKWKRANTLSQIGQRNDYLSGHFFKDKYMHQTNFISKFYSPNEIRVDSANNEASILSAYSFLRGFYSEKTEIEKGRYGDVDNSYNTIFPKKKECYRFKSDQIKNITTEENLLNIRFNKSIYEKQTSLDKFTLPFGLNQIPVHSFKYYHKSLGLDKLRECKGGLLYIEHAYHNHKDGYIDSTLKKLNQDKNLLNLLQLNDKSNLDIMTFYNISDSFASNLVRNNMNITNLAVSQDVIKMFTEFKDKFIYNILFENEYLTKLISTNSMKKIMKRIDYIVELERNELLQKSKSYKEKIRSVNEKLKSLSKLDLYFPSEEIFWGIMTYVSNLAKMKIELPSYSSFISFELVKNTSGFNLNKLLKEEDSLNDLDSERKEVKAAVLESIFRDNFGNPDKFFINVIFNDKIISQLSLNSLRQHIKTNLLSTQEVEAFCFPRKMSASNIFILLLISFVIFEILILACIYTIKS